jgi:uncharacterized protein (TIGR02246 family)
VRQINRAWRTGDASEIVELFHPDAVIIHPGFEGRTEGREDCILSYVDFAEQADIRRLEEFDPQVDVVEDTAVISYAFEIDYEMGGQAFQDSGTDLFVLARARDGRWQAVWRTLIMDAD